MKPLLLFMAMTTVLAGCLPLSIYYREGAQVSLMQRETLACEVRALRDAPVANQIRRTPPRFVPSRRICDGAGNCTTRPGYYVPGEVYTVDVNAGLRQRIEAQCMADKGFVPAKIPACPPGAAKAAVPARTAVLPRLSENSCVIRNQDGSFQIVTRQ